jgi:hypothetical protein
VGGEGGSAGTAGAGGSGGTAGAGGSGPDLTVNYLDRDPWHGYLFAQGNGLGTATRAGVCIEGEVPADPTYGSSAQLSWNINQTQEGASSTWAPTTTSLFYDLSTTYGEPLRLVIYDQSYASWCYSLSSSTGEVALTDFNTQCWNNGGSFYNGSTPLMGVQVQVVGSPSQDTPFEMCINEISPVLQ